MDLESDTGLGASASVSLPAGEALARVDELEASGSLIPTIAEELRAHVAENGELPTYLLDHGRRRTGVYRLAELSIRSPNVIAAGATERRLKRRISAGFQPTLYGPLAPRLRANVPTPSWIATAPRSREHRASSGRRSSRASPGRLAESDDPPLVRRPAGRLRR